MSPSPSAPPTRSATGVWVLPLLVAQIGRMAAVGASVGVGWQSDADRPHRLARHEAFLGKSRKAVDERNMSGCVLWPDVWALALPKVKIPYNVKYFGMDTN